MHEIVKESLKKEKSERTRMATCEGSEGGKGKEKMNDCMLTLNNTIKKKILAHTFLQASLAINFQSTYCNPI